MNYFLHSVNFQLQRTSFVRYGIFYIIVLSVLAVISCSKSERVRLPPQQWNDLVVLVETRPTPVESGMVEFLVMIGELDGKPAHDVITSVSMESAGPWRQAIQDGHTGVFRRALNVKSTEQKLYVQIQREDRTGVVEFPLSIQ